MALRTLYLVRHAEYDHADPRSPFVGKGLKRLGRKQARLTAARLARSGVRFARCYTSTFLRAVQTAEILAAGIPGLRVRRVFDLHESAGPTEISLARTARTGLSRKEIEWRKASQRQIRRVYEMFFRAPGRGVRTEILVTHGNLIRCLVNKVLGIPLDQWAVMGTHNCGITVVEVRSSKRPVLVTYNDTGHLPASLLTVPAA